MSATAAVIQPIRFVGRFATSKAPTTAKAPKPRLRCLRGGRRLAGGEAAHKPNRLDHGRGRAHGVALQRRWGVRYLRHAHPRSARRPRCLGRVDRELVLVPDARAGPYLPTHALSRRSPTVLALAPGRRTCWNRSVGLRPP